MNDKKREYLRHEIMLQIKANNLPVTGDIWISLIFASDEALIGMAQELGIRKDQPCSPQENLILSDRWV